MCAAGRSGRTAPRTEPHSQRRDPQAIEATGAIAASNEAKLSFQQSGIVKRVAVSSSATAVKQGDMLAELDTVDLELGRTQSEAQLAHANNAIRNAEQAVIVAQANYSRTCKARARVDLKAAEAALANAKANFASVTSARRQTRRSQGRAWTPHRPIWTNSRPGRPRRHAACNRSCKMQKRPAQAQFAYDNAFRRDPAGIGCQPGRVAAGAGDQRLELAKST